jgi:hypothetical protein
MLNNFAVRNPLTMPTARSAAANAPDNVLSDCLQPLGGCLLLALPMCISIVLYTNHVKETAATHVQLSDSRASATETNLPNEMRGPAAGDDAAPIVALQKSDVFLSSRQNKQTSVAAIRQEAPDYRGTFDPAKRAMGINERNSQKLIRPPVPASNSARLTISRGWYRANYPSHVKATLIAIWHQSLKRRSNAKEKSTRS